MIEDKRRKIENGRLRTARKPGLLLVYLFTCLLFLLTVPLLAGCQNADAGALPQQSAATPSPAGVKPTPTPTPNTAPTPTPYPTRPTYAPGQIVAYTAQTGDSLPALAARFNTTVAKILAANPFIPADASTMPPGMPMEIPIYYLPFWGSPYQILPDSLYINGPAQIAFNTEAFVAQQPGWLNGYTTYAAGAKRSGANMVDYVAQNFSISPQLLLALLEYQLGALSQPAQPAQVSNYALGNEDRTKRGLYRQLIWAANELNNHYYGWREGVLLELERQDGRVERPDPWQNAATVAFQAYFIELYPFNQYAQAIGPDGFADTFRTLFGDPWAAEPHIPGSLRQPELSLPFEPRRMWAYTGGPHSSWGTGLPLAAIDFAPPSKTSGCVKSNQWATAMAGGVVTRSGGGIVALDLDLDGDEHTGWVLFYLHIGTAGRAPVGAILNAGDPLGHPSCEGGISTGSHIHVARKYNGEWIAADGAIAFNLEGWVAHNGSQPYKGTLTSFSQTVTACTCANSASQIMSRRER